MTEFVALRAKAYAYLMEDGSEHKKTKGTKKCVIKRGLMFENYIDSLFHDKIILKSQQRFKIDRSKVYKEEVSKIALSSNDDKRLQRFHKITSHPYGINAFNVRESEFMIVRDIFVKNYADCPFYYEVISIQNKRIQSMRKCDAK